MTIRSMLLTGATALAFCVAHAADAQTVTPAALPAGDGSSATAPQTVAADDAPDGEIVVRGTATRSVTQISGSEIQKILPGLSPLKALQTLPGVTFLTADPWGNNEQNISLFIHGFNAQQLGYTLDGVPLGDQQYGNYNGLSPQRAIISEDVGRVVLASGAGDLGTASTSNLGGAIDTFSSDPRDAFGITLQQVVGSYDTSRTYGRIDSGDIGYNTRFYVSGVRHDARAWDFNGKQGGYQADGKIVHDDATGKLTAFFSYSDKTEPNEDATAIVVRPATATSAAVDNRGVAPYTRPFFYPDFAAARAYYGSAEYAAVNAAPGSNYRNYYSDAQRTDYLGYVKYDWHAAPGLTWSNQAYFHHNDGVGVVAGPITAAGLPLLFSFYYPGAAGSNPNSAANLARLSTIFGGSGLATRTTEYRIDRVGAISTLVAQIGNHNVEIGGWYEHQSSSAYRRWYALDVNDPSSPYTRPLDEAQPLITQYGSEIRVEEIQTHIQDAWQIVPSVTLQAGFKSTFQKARQTMPVQPIPGSFTGSREFPVGRLNTNKVFLPQVGGLWDVTGHEQLFFNVQQNIRQFQTSAAAGLSPFALGSQTLFEFFKDNTKPETSWTYEAGARTRRTLDAGPLTGFEGQISYYHVDFSNRLLAVSPTATITAIQSGAPIINNVGSVRTDGVDIAGTFRFGDVFTLYNALSYNNSRYSDDYLTGAGAAQTTVPTAGKKVPGSPDWLNKTVATLRTDGVEVQLIGDYIGRRYATYTNDLSVNGYLQLSGRIGFDMPLSGRGIAKTLNVSVNVTNLTNKRAESTLSIGAASGTYNFFPVAPRQVFATIRAGF
ncbi:TonB-dependent receptor [Sphingomonas melonis]|uniref:Outer membrane receptor protein involved in Fe transport n=1 Tax=Sphingomonas melonis TaxID=152682 RepID=A0A7Y9K3T7_9SPHN|nr:TonB-dependent receptor [Sphingomonas melonis]NYD90695.1 outer membrane receptor protein involved in Fe transport [Sphingomonas melonis]